MSSAARRASRSSGSPSPWPTMRRTSGSTRPRIRAHGRSARASNSSSSSSGRAFTPRRWRTRKTWRGSWRPTPATPWPASKQQKDLPALQAVRAALEEALGMKFTDEKGEHFFRSTLVQTLFYGVFSAWVRWHKDKPRPRRDAFDWRTAEWSLHVPFIRTLYEQVATPSQLGPLGLVEVLDWAAGALNRVDRAAFFKTLRGRARGSVLLRAVPGSLRPGAAQGTGRLVHAAGDRQVPGGPRGSRCCARNWTCPTGWPIRTSSCSTPVAARGRIWSKCCTASRRRCATRAATPWWRPT